MAPTLLFEPLILAALHLFARWRAGSVAHRADFLMRTDSVSGRLLPLFLLATGHGAQCSLILAGWQALFR